ncbi:hypothetical protein CLAIMM_00237 [Cladophialophora immunda]|nr:hypothetical protein CLAIMM_00237 [Cladophialophora immunda]
MNTFTRLVRFEDDKGQIHYGEAGDQWENSLHGLTLPTFDGDALEQSLKLSGRTAKVAKVLCPLSAVPVIFGIGLNYRKHAEETGFPLPSYPLVFTKPSDSLAGPYEDIPIDPDAKELDYEVELTVIIGRDVKNLAETEDPLEYILGCTVGNDVSARYWQTSERSAGQHGYAKSFDKFAPLGPVIASLTALGDPHKLRLRTWVNGQLRQDGSTDDMIFSIGQIVRHLSKGRTLRKGTAIMTGTPSGVAAFMNPPAWLQHGDQVEIEIEKIGKMSNRVVFA